MDGDRRKELEGSAQRRRKEASVGDKAESEVGAGLAVGMWE